MIWRRRRSYYGYSEFPEYVSVGEKRAKAERSLAQLKKSNPAVNPVVIAGSTIATSWWGKSWNKNLEGYADYSNRIGRGRSYVRNGAVLDLQIKPGEITALVQGSRSKPYSVVIQIKEITATAWESMKKACAGKLDSLPELLAGKFPKALGELFTERGKGLFPSPREIAFSCSCPDDAAMCKHVAAALYGIGARLDGEPGLFFTLRKVEIKDLVSETVQRKSQELLKKAKKKSSRVLEDSDLSGIFGIQLDEKPTGSITPASTPPKLPILKKSAVLKKVAPVKVTVKVTRKPKPDSNWSAKIKSPDAIELAAGIFRQSKEGVDAVELKYKMGLDIKEIQKIIVKLKKEGKIKNLARGVYVGA
jgi:uncharacterized Zn finger protein